MHPNPIFRKEEEARAFSFAQKRGFGLLLVNGPEAVPLTAHIPFLLRPKPQRALLHLVVSNPIYRLLGEDPMAALISVSGPDSYISPDWYGVDDQVPTWNYVAVNLRGRLSKMDPAQTQMVIDAQSQGFEARLAPKPIWQTEKMTKDVLHKLMRQIRPLALEIETIESTFKLGQNKPPEVRQRAAQKVASDGIGANVQDLAKLMEDG